MCLCGELRVLVFSTRKLTAASLDVDTAMETDGAGDAVALKGFFEDFCAFATSALTVEAARGIERDRVDVAE